MATKKQTALPESVKRFCEMQINDLTKKVQTLEITIRTLTESLKANKTELQQIEALMGKKESPLGMDAPNRQTEK